MLASVLAFAVTISMLSQATQQALPPPPPMPEMPGAPPGFNALRDKANALHEQQRFGEEAELYASVVKERPAFVYARYARLRAQISDNQHATEENLAAARAGGFATPEDHHLAATWLTSIVMERRYLPAEDAVPLLKEALAHCDEALKSGETMETLVYKAIALGRLARFEKDPAAAKKLTDEADRLRARAIELQKKRIGGGRGAAPRMDHR